MVEGGPEEVGQVGRLGTGLVVAFEGRHHLWRYPAEPPLAGAPTPLPIPPGLATCGSNQGVEAAARRQRHFNRLPQSRRHVLPSFHLRGLPGCFQQNTLPFGARLMEQTFKARRREIFRLRLRPAERSKGFLRQAGAGLGAA